MSGQKLQFLQSCTELWHFSNPSIWFSFTPTAAVKSSENHACCAVSEPLCDRLRPYDRGLVHQAVFRGRQGCPAGHFGHGWPGGVQRHAGAVHEVGGGVPPRLLTHRQGLLRRDLQVPQTDTQSQRQGRVSHHPGGEQVGLNAAESGEQSIHILTIHSIPVRENDYSLPYNPMG